MYIKTNHEDKYCTTIEEWEKVSREISELKQQVIDLTADKEKLLKDKLTLIETSKPKQTIEDSQPLPYSIDHKLKHIIEAQDSQYNSLLNKVDHQTRIVESMATRKPAELEIEDYFLVAEHYQEQFNESVNKKLQEGYVLYYSPAIGVSTIWAFAQAMVKYKQ